MAEPSELGSFLRSLRTRVTPEGVGYRVANNRRKVAGMRREEVAQLAGLSVSYYTSLEQGRSVHASPEVLRAIGRALRVDEFEEMHLLNLAALRPTRSGSSPSLEEAHPQLRDLLEAMPQLPAFVHGLNCDILAWNRLGHALYASHLDHDTSDPDWDPGGSETQKAQARVPGDCRPNIARLVFLDPRSRELYDDWTAKAESLVALLRHNLGRFPRDRGIADLIAELRTASDDFVDLWGRHLVKPCGVMTVTLQHPWVGTMTLTQQALVSVVSPTQTLVTATAEAGSRSAESLCRLEACVSDAAAPHLSRVVTCSTGLCDRVACPR